MSELNDLIRIKDIADRANTSIGTVDRVIHNRPGVSEKTRQRVLEILKEYNYKPNLIARRLAGNKIFKIAVLLPAPTIDFWKIHPEGITKATEEVTPFGIEVDTFTFEFNSQEEYAQSLERIEQGGYDAILTVPVYYEEIIPFLDKTKLPSIFFDTNIDIKIDDKINTAYIGENAYQTGIIAGKLLSSGIQQTDKILIISISNRSNNHLRWLDREVGLKDFFTKENSSDILLKEENIIKIELSDLESKSIEEQLTKVFTYNPNISRVFINSCRGTSLCAPHLQKWKQKSKNIKIVGYDLTKDNILFLKNGVIDFLLNKHPKEQCYNGIKMLYENLVMKISIPEKTYMPIDIIISENVDYYNTVPII